MSTSSAANFFDIEVASVGVGCKNHAAGSVGDSVVGISGDVVKELVDGGSSVFGGSNQFR